MSGKNLSEQEYHDVHDAIVVLLAVAGDCSVAFSDKVGQLLRRAHDAVRTERDPPFMLLPHHKGNKRLALPEGVRAMVQDQYLMAPKALGKSNGSA